MRTRYEVVIITIYANWYIFWQMFQFITFHLNAQIFEINIRYLQLWTKASVLTCFALTAQAPIRATHSPFMYKTCWQKIDEEIKSSVTFYTRFMLRSIGLKCTAYNKVDIEYKLVKKTNSASPFDSICVTVNRVKVHRFVQSWYRNKSSTIFSFQKVRWRRPWSDSPWIKIQELFKITTLGAIVFLWKYNKMIRNRGLFR